MSYRSREAKRILRRESRLSARLWGAAAILPLCWAAPAMAQGVSASAGGTGGAGWEVGELLVTAQKREQSIIDIPASVSAFGGEKLSELGLRTVSDLTTQVPNFQVYHDRGPNTLPNFTIRGVRDTPLNSRLNESSVAVYSNEVFIGDQTSINAAMFDVERVEVLRGPQGTVFGKNTTAGLIHFISVKPTAEFSGFASLQYGRANQFIGEGAVSGPLTDRVRFRLAGMFNRDDGPYRNRYVGAGQNGVEKRVGDTDRWAVRGTLDVDLTDQTLLRVIASYYNDDSQVPATYAMGALLPGTTITTGLTRANFCSNSQILRGRCISVQQIGTPPAPPIDGAPLASGITNLRPEELRQRHRDTSLTAILTHDFDWARLTSVSNYSFAQGNERFDADAGGTPGAIVGGLNFDYLVNYANKSHQVSQELRLDGSTEAFDWVVGGLFYHDHKRSLTDLFLRSNNGLHFFATGAAKSTSYALFSQVDLHLSDQFTLSIGGRYTIDKRTLTEGTTVGVLPSGNVAVPFQNVVGAMAAAGLPTSALNKDFTGKISLSWKPDENNNFYATYSRGAHGAGFNSGFSPTVPIAANMAVAGPIAEEQLDSFEIGSKNRLFDRRLNINTSAFFYDFRNRQDALAVLDPVTRTPVTNYINVGDVRIYGVETEMTFRAMENLDINFSGGWLYSNTYRSDVTIVDSFGQSQPLEGLPVSRIPKWSLASSVAYHIPTSQGRFTLQPELTATAKVNNSLAQDPLAFDPSHVFVNFRVFWKSEGGRYNAQAFVTNVFKERNTFSISDVVLGSRGQLILVQGLGRQWGLKLGATF